MRRQASRAARRASRSAARSLGLRDDSVFWFYAAKDRY
jgi:mevalonate pyrophosphate decarboxylase